MYEHLNTLLSSLLAAYRKNYSCEHVLTKLVEDCKYAIDNKHYFGIILTDLSKAFDCLPHRLLLSKLHNYGMSLKSCKLMRSYLNHRLQRVKVGSSRSDWEVVRKGVPQGSVLGPLLFNVFINDLICQLSDHSLIYNFADDNTLGASHTSMSGVIMRLESSSKLAITWFEDNHMLVNLDKFKALLFRPDQTDQEIELDIANQKLVPETNVKTLGLHIDKDLNYKKHISVLCAKASRQISALKRISKYLSLECRLNIFNAFIKSNFIYGNTLWHFCSNNDTYKMEKVQKRALRVVTNDYESSYESLLEKVSCKTLYLTRVHAFAVEMFKCIHGINPEFITNLFCLSDHGYNTRGGTMVIQPKVNTNNFGINSFRYQGPKIWNQLPTTLKTCESLAQFKQHLNHGMVSNAPACHANFVMLQEYEKRIVAGKYNYLHLSVLCTTDIPNNPESAASGDKL